VAKQIHLKSNRKDAPFMIINCAGLTDDRGEAEIFGEEKNGEVIKTGILEKADGGTVLLDEVHEMPIGIQSKMVRFIQEEGFERLHGNKRIKSDIRFLSSSTKDLLAEVKAGKLREDLYYRLNVIPVRIPPLKERRGDIALLVSYFLNRFATMKSKDAPHFKNDALTLFESYDWPGNVRQLKNILEWLMIINAEDCKEITADMLPAEINSSAPDSLRWERSESIMSLPLKDARDVFEKEYLEAQLKRFGDNVSKTASFVGMERSALYRKFKTLGIDTKN